MAPVSDPAPAHSPWNSPWAPLSLAAYVTWLAITLEPLRGLGAGRLLLDAITLIGLAGLVSVLLLFILRARSDDDPSNGRLSQGLVLAQAVGALLAIWGLPTCGSMPVLLIIVAAQLSAIFRTRAALLYLLAINAALATLLISRWNFSSALPALLSFGGFQAFAALTTMYARRAEDARDQLRQINAELLATRHLLLESARGEERLRLSRDLHDVAGHKLTALKLQLRVIERELPESQRGPIAACVRLSDELLADVRGVVDTLRAHDGIDLHAALGALLPQLPRPQIRLELAAEARVAGLDQAQALLRCAQEGLTNALRHSAAEHVVLRLLSATDGTELQVEDDGRASAVPAFGNGLRGMRERLAALGGRLELELVEGGGLRLRACLPSGLPA